MLTIQAPAKINLTLEVLSKRGDDFHEIRSVIQTINLCDSLHFELTEDISFNWDNPVIIPEESLAFKAVMLLRESIGCTDGALVQINKRIPLVSGLGGDSSDAAAVLLGLNRLWNLGLSREELSGLAARLGSDVTFFLYGGTALLEGRGEIVNQLLPIPNMWVVLLVPPVSRTDGKTARLYASLKPEHYTGGEISDRLESLLTSGSEIESSVLFNVFDEVAENNFPGLDEYRQQFLQAGAQEVHLAGSGPTLFTLLKNKAQAEDLYNCLKGNGLETYLADSLTAVDYK
ncbi:4-(cytidine 5'-diphospho)-2-C-methyl-D-erythritol kinase [Chloroflexota bacterium]